MTLSVGLPLHLSRVVAGHDVVVYLVKARHAAVDLDAGHPRPLEKACEKISLRRFSGNITKSAQSIYGVGIDGHHLIIVCHDLLGDCGVFTVEFLEELHYLVAKRF